MSVHTFFRTSLWKFAATKIVRFLCSFLIRTITYSDTVYNFEDEKTLHGQRKLMLIKHTRLYDREKIRRKTVQWPVDKYHNIVYHNNNDWIDKHLYSTDNLLIKGCKYLAISWYSLLLLSASFENISAILLRDFCCCVDWFDCRLSSSELHFCHNRDENNFNK